MNRNRLLMIGFVALALGGFVAAFVYRQLKSGATSDARPGVSVVVAATDIQVGEKIDDGDVSSATPRRRSAQRFL